MGTEIEKSIARIMEPLKRGEDLGTDAVEGFKAAKNAFTKEVDNLYEKVERSLGGNTAIVPIGSLQKSLNDMSELNPDLKKLLDSRLGKILASSRKKAKERLRAREQEVQGPPVSKFTQDDILREMYLTPQKAQLVRKVLTELEHSREFQNNFAVGSQFRELMDKALVETEDNLNIAISRLENGSDEIMNFGVKRILDDIGSDPTSIKKLKEGFTLLRRTRGFYARGNARLNDPVVQNIFRVSRSGKIQVDPTKILDNVVKSNQPKLLERLLLSRKGVMSVVGDAEPPKVVFGGKEYSIEEAEALLARGGFRDRTTMEARQARDPRLDIRPGSYKDPREQRLKDAIRFAKEELEATKSEKFLREVIGQGEDLRQQIASAWVKRLMDDPTRSMSTKNGVQVYDGIKIAGEIDKLGTTKNVLFRKELKQIDDLASLLRGTGATFDRATFRRLQNAPLAQAATELREQVAKNQA